MAYSRLLLLMIGVIATLLPQLWARPTDFWCNCQARKSMERRIEGMQTDVVHCVGSDTLSSPAQLPCVWVHTAEWANKTLQEKRAEVSETLQVFQDVVQGAKSQATLSCQTSLLESIERHISNYQAIISRLQIESDSATASNSSVQSCFRGTSLSEVLEQYRTLVRGKLEHLATDLQGVICKERDAAADTAATCGET